MDLLVRIEKLEKMVAEQAKIIDTQAKALEAKDDVIASQAKEIVDLKKELAQYENPHTPPSARRFKEKPEDSAPKKRGAPKGHRGATRPTPVPEEIVEVAEDQVGSCPKCNGRSLEPMGCEAHERPVIEDILVMPKVKATQYNRWMIKCLDCGHEFTARHRDCPQKGRFGVNLLTYVAMLKFSLRGVLRKTGSFTAHANGFEISPKGLQDMLLRVGEACKAEYQRILERVRDAEWRYMDETGMRVMGKNWWLWIFRTSGDDVLAVIRPSRGGKVLKEILGARINGAGISDGWRAYSAFQVLQRCWAHLLREVDAYKDKPGGKELSLVIHRKFKRLRQFLAKDPPMRERKRTKEFWDREMEELLEEFSGFKELKKPLTYVRNGLGSWYTCLLYPGMEPTNNLGEQAMREHVIVRKIIGAFRSEKGAENYQYIASLLATWQLQGKDIYKELEELLRRELCLR